MKLLSYMYLLFISVLIFNTFLIHYLFNCRKVANIWNLEVTGLLSKLSLALFDKRISLQNDIVIAPKHTPVANGHNLKTKYGTGHWTPMAINTYMDAFNTHDAKPCLSLIRPKNIPKHKSVYQYLHMKFINAVGFMLNFYYDHRFSTTEGTFVRTVLDIKHDSSLGYPATRNETIQWHWKIYNTPLYCLLWYERFQNPLSSTCHSQSAQALQMQINGTYYYSFVVTCRVPDLDLIPIHASLVEKECSIPVNYLDIIQPEPKVSLNTLDIGLCLQPLFGSLDKSDVPYFVSFMEMQKLLGISEITVTNVSLVFKDNLIHKAFSYYQSAGYLTLLHYPIIHPFVNNNQDEMAGSYSVKQLVVSDCFLRKTKKLWYILIHDLDEVIIPSYHYTLQEYILALFKAHPETKNSMCLTVRSSYFYRFMENKSDFPDHLPLLRYTLKYPTEPLGVPNVNDVGMSKSISNMKQVVSVDSHLCREGHQRFQEGTKTFLADHEILVHHYRKHCESLHPNNARCLNNSTETIQDTTIYKYSEKLIYNVEKVLSDIGYIY